MTNDAKLAYEARRKRIEDAVALKTPDRVPVMYFAHYFATRQAGMSNRDAMFKHEEAAEAHNRVVLDLEPDSFTPFFLNSGPLMESLDYRQVQWPGHKGLSEDAPFQYLDKEYMKASEYGAFLTDPSGFFLKTYLARVAGVYAPFTALPTVASQFYFQAVTLARYFADPEMIAAMEKLAEAGRESLAAMKVLGQSVRYLEERGIPLGIGANSAAPYDVVSDYLRGSKGAMLDMFRNKDKMLAAIDRVYDLIVEGAVAMGQGSPSKSIFIPLHWGLDGFMSPEQFKTFFWPSLRKLTIAFIEAGLTPCLFWEGDCTSRLDIIKDIPPGKCIYFFERSDLFKAKKTLGDTVCIRGGVPASLLVSGKPQEVADHCKRLIDELGRDGGFIMDASVGIPDEARYENVKAMFDTARAYGQR